MKRFISLLIIFGIYINLMSPAFAAELTSKSDFNELNSPKVTVQGPISDDKYMVKVEFDDHYEIAIRDNRTYEIVTRIYDLDGRLINEFYTDASAILHLEDTPQANDYYQHTFSEYEYDVDSSGRHEQWTCRRVSDYKTRTKLPGSITEERLNQWKYFVDEINDLELDLIANSGIAIAEMIITELLTGGLATALALIEGTATITGVVVDLYTAQENADAVFDRL